MELRIFIRHYTYRDTEEYESIIESWVQGLKFKVDQYSPTWGTIMDTTAKQYIVGSIVTNSGKGTKANYRYGTSDR